MQQTQINIMGAGNGSSVLGLLLYARHQLFFQIHVSLNPQNSHLGRFYYTHFKDKETEACEVK